MMPLTKNLTTFDIYTNYIAHITARPAMYVGAKCTVGNIELILLGILIAFDGCGGRRAHNFGEFLMTKYSRSKEDATPSSVSTTNDQGFWEGLLRAGHPDKKDIDLIRQLGDDFRQWAETGPELSKIA